MLRRTAPLVPVACAGGLVLALGLTACQGTPASPTTPAELERAAAGITPATVAAHIGWLAADAQRGRWTPSPELRRSAEYVAAAFRAAGLRPGGDDGSYLQRWPCGSLSGADRPANVIAWRRGSDARLASEWVVLTAHYDGLGVRRPDASGDSIYNGADDDASGTAAVLEVARALAGLRTAPARSLAFVVMSGEELGLVGSWWFVDHRPAAMAGMVATVNLDMVGRNAPSQLYALGEAWSSVGDVTRAIADGHPELGFHMVALTNEERGFERSDHFPFAWRGIPSIFLNTGPALQYHTPSDDAGRIDNDKVSRVARLTLYLAYDLASRPERPSWHSSWQSARAGFTPIQGTCKG